MRPIALLVLVLPTIALAQTPLQTQIATIAADARGTVSVSCRLPGTALHCDLNPHTHAPMQSIFKYPLALTVLHLAETGKLFAHQHPGEPISTILERPVRYLPQDRIPGSFSPLQDQYPHGDVDIPLGRLIQLCAGQSDNVASETLLRIAGGPSVVETYIHSLGIAAFQLKDGEQAMDRNEALQYRNWIEPTAAVQLLERLVDDPPLSPAANAFLVQVLTDSRTAPDRLRAGLPAGTVMAHKTGTSGTRDGLSPATNDIGLITLPDGRHLALAVLVTDSHADDATRAAVIARIGKAVYTQALMTR